MKDSPHVEPYQGLSFGRLDETPFEALGEDPLTTAELVWSPMGDLPIWSPMRGSLSGAPLGPLLRGGPFAAAEPPFGDLWGLFPFGALSGLLFRAAR